MDEQKYRSFKRKRVGLHRSLTVRWKKLVCSESRWEFVCFPETLTIPLHSYVWKECITNLLFKKKKKTSSKLVQFSQWFHYISGHSDLLGNLSPLSFISWIDLFPSSLTPFSLRTWSLIPFQPPHLLPAGTTARPTFLKQCFLIPRVLAVPGGACRSQDSHAVSPAPPSCSRSVVLFEADSCRHLLCGGV